MNVRLFKPKVGSVATFNKDGIAIKDIKNIKGTDGILVTYKDNSKTIFRNYNYFINKVGNKEIYNPKVLKSIDALVESTDINVGDIVYYDNDFAIVGKIENGLGYKFINNLDPFNDGSCVAYFPFKNTLSDLTGNLSGRLHGNNVKINENGLRIFGKASGFKLDNNYITNHLVATFKITFNNIHNGWIDIIFGSKDNKGALFPAVHGKKLSFYPGNYINEINNAIIFKKNIEYLVYAEVILNENNYIEIGKVGTTLCYNHTTNITISTIKVGGLGCLQWAGEYADINIKDMRFFNRSLTDNEINVLDKEENIIDLTKPIKKLVL